MSEPISNEKVQKVLESPEMKAKVDEPTTEQKVREGFDKAFDKVKGRLGEAAKDVRDIYDMAFDKEFGMKDSVKYAAVGALLYLISPIDILPEAALGPLGLVDDIAVLMFAINYAKPEIERFRAYKAAKATPPTKT